VWGPSKGSRLIDGSIGRGRFVSATAIYGRHGSRPKVLLRSGQRQRPLGTNVKGMATPERLSGLWPRGGTWVAVGSRMFAFHFARASELRESSSPLTSRRPGRRRIVYLLLSTSIRLWKEATDVVAAYGVASSLLVLIFNQSAFIIFLFFSCPFSSLLAEDDKGLFSCFGEHHLPQRE